MGIQQALFFVNSQGAGTILPSGSATWEISDVQYGGIESAAGLSFNSNGTVTYLGNLVPGPPTNWNSPTAAGVGNSWWIRATLQFGTPTGGTFNTWLALSSNRDFFVSASSGFSQSATITVEFSPNSSGSPILATHTNIQMSAFSNSGPPP